MKIKIVYFLSRFLWAFSFAFALFMF